LNLEVAFPTTLQKSFTRIHLSSQITAWAATHLFPNIQPPAATCLRAHPGRRKARQQPNSGKPQSHKTDYRDWILALTADNVAKGFKLKHTRNDVTEEHCACSIVALAAELHENTVQNAWHRYKGIADQRTATNYVPQVMVSVPYDGIITYDGIIRSHGRTMKTIPPSAHSHFLVRFPRVNSIEAMPRPKPRPKRKK